jgi:cyclophilin family peptidyl-prolyl cis-trans isomerase/HEAT repeat protein
VRCSKARRSAVLAVVVGLVAGCRTVPVATENDRLAARARLIRIEDTRRIDAAFLDSALRSADPSLRRSAALTVGRVGARTQAAALRTLTTDPDASVAGAAFYALGLIKDTAAVALATAGLRGAADVASEAAWLLGEVGGPGRAPLLAVALDPALDSRRRGAALLALARSKPPPVAPLLPLLDDADTAVAWRAAYVLARARSAGAVRAMIGASASPAAQVRDYAARGLARSLTGDSLEAQAHEALRRLVVDPDARVRVTAVRVLGPYGTPTGPAIATALRDTDPAVRITAASVAHVAFDTSARAWAAAWRSDTSFAFRRALAEAGARRNMLRDAWRDWRADSRWQYRAAVATLDGIGPAGAALDRLDGSLRDVDGRVRAAAVGAVAALADSAGVTGAARRRLRATLTDPDFVVRATALGALAKGATIDDLAAASEAYAIARRDADLDARLAFWTLADSALRNHGTTLPDSVVRTLAAIPRPADPLERARAASIPRFTAWRDSTGLAREDGWYRVRAREALASRAPVARIETERGTIELLLFPAEAPITVHNFVSLANRRYFDGQRFHRVVPNFVVQAGDPRGDGNGGPGYAIRDELNPHRYVRGALGMALSGPNTGGSQFFVTHTPQPHLDGGYTVFGQLRAGGDALDRIVQGDRIVRITIH